MAETTRLANLAAAECSMICNTDVVEAPWLDNLIGEAAASFRLCLTEGDDGHGPALRSWLCAIPPIAALAAMGTGRTQHKCQSGYRAIEGATSE